MANATPNHPTAPGIVSADCLYTLDEIHERLKLGQAAMRQAGPYRISAPPAATG